MLCWDLCCGWWHRSSYGTYILVLFSICLRLRWTRNPWTHSNELLSTTTQYTVRRFHLSFSPEPCRSSAISNYRCKPDWIPPTGLPSKSFFVFRLMLFKGDMGKLPAFRSELTNAVYVTSDISMAYFNKLSRGRQNDLVPLSKEKLWTAYLTIFLHKQSCLTASFNPAIEKFTEHGFFTKWTKDYTVANGMRNIDAPQILMLHQIQGIFHLCAGLYILAIIVFLVEIISVKWRRM